MKTFKTPKGTSLPILDFKGKDYMQIAQRLVWFREELPKWRIETEFLILEERFVIAKATIRNESGEIMATAHKREDAGHFGDFMEKAETGSIGRALAYCGFGTQFCADEIDEGERIVDAPIQRAAVTSIKKEIKSVQAVKAAPISHHEKAPPPASSSWEEFNKQPIQRTSVVIKKKAESV